MKILGGFFITLEGIDGCGKTTQAMRLAEHLKAKGFEIVHTREPGGTATGLRIRAILLDPESKGMTGLTELLLYSADRAQHLAEVIEPALKKGAVVVCDRFADATVAYQGHARGEELDTINTLTDIATRGCRPDLTILLDLPADVALGRAIGRNDKEGSDAESRFEMEAIGFHERVRQGYLTIAACEPERVKIIDATGTVDGIQTAIRAVVDAAMGGKR